ncbi:hypothetical protein [Sphingobacterium griseoflavum]|uniref:Uncharacterized protein n=1 Tax=Sphingobacterium griseoflavum TaxID=1474952 RepID=A0ABQ3HVA1_9SPHI|nr:hypothetical protein [Sphingobacterium griseoflavum]GHE29925.1 hypothetical protein GCM10017764_11230 [Sphingobacterium griseoflavum]
MNQLNNPLRQMVLAGKARTDFFAWYQSQYNEKPNQVDLWPIAKQLEHFTAFFKKPIQHANDFYMAQAFYNAAAEGQL